MLLTRASCGAATNSSAIEQFCEWFWMKTALVATELAFDVNRPSGPGGSELRNMGGLHEGHVSVAASARLQSMRSRSHRRDLQPARSLARTHLMRSIQDLTIKPSRETKMSKSSLVAFLPLLLIAAASPSFCAHERDRNGFGSRTKPAERAASVVSRDGWVGTLRSLPKTCSYRGGPKTGMWSCVPKRTTLLNGGSLR